MKEAVDLRRELARDNPGEHNANLAVSLRGLGLVYFKLDRYEDALSAMTEAVELARELTHNNPGQFNAAFAGHSCYFNLLFHFG